MTSILRRTLRPWALLILLLSPAQAWAATYLFTVTGNASGQFTLPSSPTPSSSDPFGFTVQSVTGTFNGSAATFNLTFWLLSTSGGMDLDLLGGGGLSTQGDQLFTGSQSSPTFRTGTFALSTFGSENDRAYSLTISAIPDAVPEPATWAMMMLGLAAVGVASRRGFARAT